VTFVTWEPEHLRTVSPSHLYTAPDMADVLERLKVLINSSTPIVVMETVEEVRAVSLVRTACAAVNLPTFEWTIAKGLVRSGSSASVVGPDPAAVICSGQTAPHTPNGGSEAERLANAVLSSLQKPGANSTAGLYNSREPVQALETLESITVDAVFILKDFQREAIVAIQVALRRHKPEEFDIKLIAQKAQGYSGAEINAAIQTAMYQSFSEKQPMTTKTLLDALAATVLLSTTRAEEIAALREWAKHRAVPASLPDAKAQAAQTAP
jgi:hypothetical protein